MKFTHVLHALHCEPWLITEQYHAALVDIVENHIAGTPNAGFMDSLMPPKAEQAVLKNRFLNPVWSWVIADGIQNHGLPTPPDALNWYKVKWMFPAHPTVDVGRESAANLNENRQGLKTADEIYSEEGHDSEEEFEQLGKEAARRKQIAEQYNVDPSEIRMLTPNGNPAQMGAAADDVAPTLPAKKD